MTSIPSLLVEQHDFFSSGSTKPLTSRKQALKRLKKAIVEREDAICDALYSDFKKPKFESLATETQMVLAELNHIINNVAFWARPKRVPLSLSNFPSRDWIQYEPFGQVLVISPWNYPFMLAMSPLIGAVAAGNTVVLKPSELSPATSKILDDIISEVFDAKHVAVVEGGVETSQELLAQKWNYIFFTGSTRVGKIVYKSAAAHLTPVTLELGGKNPCIIDASAPVKLAAKRIVWGKFINAGQTCLAPDYLLVHEAVKDKLVAALQHHIIEFYGEDVQASNDFARIATEGQYKRLKAMLNDGTLRFGGKFDDDDRYISPTLLENPSMDSEAMQGEIFGPVLPIFSYEKESDIERYIENYGRPLALYVFSNRKSFLKRILTRFSFGGGAINDTVIHITNKNMPFGGVGNSGFGGYHGKHSFELFSHKKSIVKKANWLDLPFRYPPYNMAETLIKKFKHLL
ncbi:aldehyde dehydrogenase [Allomuricauda sp. d1]|uniref:aldehyde dehydrogenase n=1 Tax=Allomuricauda sp. d1 TaxID=3136725 RepID=UPI0031D81049